MNTNLTPYGKVCREYPDGTKVRVTTHDGRSFIARSDGDGTAWVNGNAWIHPIVACIPQDVRDACMTCEIALAWEKA